MSKVRKIIIIAAIFDILAACGVAVVFYMHQNSQLELKANKLDVEYGETISLDASDYLKKSVDKDIVKNTKVTYRKDPVEGKKYDNIGRYTVKLTYKKEVAKVRVTVKDTTKPKFNKINSFESIRGVELPWEDYIKATDLAEVDLKIDDSAVDINKVGEYTLKAVAEDESGNEREKEIKVSIKDRPDNMTAHSIEVDEKTGAVIVTAILQDDNNDDGAGARAANSNSNSGGYGNYGNSGNSGGSQSPSSGTSTPTTNTDPTEPAPPIVEPDPEGPTDSNDSGGETLE